ncbi:MAG: hypothetical protein PHV63_01945 [Candidatus Daviesbacteria bacterium]|nr:hypothetical protein [Candidatus Daviesbacteria bacterium]
MTTPEQGRETGSIISTDIGADDTVLLNLVSDKLASGQEGGRKGRRFRGGQSGLGVVSLSTGILPGFPNAILLIPSGSR